MESSTPGTEGSSRIRNGTLRVLGSVAWAVVRLGSQFIFWLLLWLGLFLFLLVQPAAYYPRVAQLGIPGSSIISVSILLSEVISASIFLVLVRLSRTTWFVGESVQRCFESRTRSKVANCLNTAFRSVRNYARFRLGARYFEPFLLRNILERRSQENSFQPVPRTGDEVFETVALELHDLAHHDDYPWERLTSRLSPLSESIYRRGNQGAAIARALADIFWETNEVSRRLAFSSPPGVLVRFLERHPGLPQLIVGSLGIVAALVTGFVP